MNTIQQINTNQNLSFKKLHKVNFSKDFDIKNDKNCTKAFQAFKDSYTLKRFFDSYDVIADFSLNKKDKTGFLNFYFSKIEETSKKAKESIKNCFDNNKFRLLNIIATYDYKTMHKDISTLDFDDLINKADKKSKNMNFLEKENFKNIIRNIETENTKNILLKKESNIPSNGISDLSKKLLKKTNNIIEENWILLRKKNKNIHTLEFKEKIKNKNVILKPIYINGSRKLLLEINSGNEIKKVHIDSQTFDYKYEKYRKTEFGSALVKKVDSKINSDIETNQLVSEIIETFIPKINKKYEIKSID